MKTILFEDPTVAYVLLGIVELGLLIAWFRLRSRELLYALAVTLGVVGMLAAISALVVTDRERITSAIEQIAGASEQQDLSPARQFLDDSLEYEGMPPDELIDMAETMLRELAIKRVNLTDLTVDVKDSQATSKVSTSIVYVDPELGERLLPVHWTFEWRKVGDSWRIVHMERPTVSLMR